MDLSSGAGVDGANVADHFNLNSIRSEHLFFLIIIPLLFSPFFNCKKRFLFLLLLQFAAEFSDLQTDAARSQKKEFTGDGFLHGVRGCQ